MTHQEFVQSLRNAADFFEARPELGLPTTDLQYSFCGLIAGLESDSREGLAAFARICGGRIEKETTEDFFKLVSKQDGFVVKAVAYRKAVCQRVQIGTKVEPEQIIPAIKAKPKEVIPAREVAIFEWRCPRILSEAEEATL